MTSWKTFHGMEILFFFIKMNDNYTNGFNERVRVRARVRVRKMKK